MEKDIETNIEALQALLEALVEFGVAYGFQILAPASQYCWADL
jgi:hypothetical protein